MGSARTDLRNLCNHRRGGGSGSRAGHSDCLLPQQRDSERGRNRFDEMVGKQLSAISRQLSAVSHQHFAPWGVCECGKNRRLAESRELKAESYKLTTED